MVRRVAQEQEAFRNSVDGMDARTGSVVKTLAKVFAGDKSEEFLKSSTGQMMSSLVSRGLNSEMLSKYTGGNFQNFATGVGQMTGFGGVSFGENGQLGNSRANAAVAVAVTKELQKEFFTSGGVSRLNQTHGMNRDQLGQITARLGQDGAFAGMSAGEVAFDEAGAPMIKIDKDLVNRVKNQVSDAADTLKNIKDLFGDRSIGELSDIAESFAGMRIGTVGASKLARQRLHDIAGASLSAGWDPRRGAELFMGISQSLGNLPQLQGKAGMTADLAVGATINAASGRRLALQQFGAIGSYHGDMPSEAQITANAVHTAADYARTGFQDMTVRAQYAVEHMQGTVFADTGAKFLESVHNGVPTDPAQRAVLLSQAGMLNNLDRLVGGVERQNAALSAGTRKRNAEMAQDQIQAMQQVEGVKNINQTTMEMINAGYQKDGMKFDAALAATRKDMKEMEPLTQKLIDAFGGGKTAQLLDDLNDEYDDNKRAQASRTLVDGLGSDGYLQIQNMSARSRTALRAGIMTTLNRGNGTLSSIDQLRKAEIDRAAYGTVYSIGNSHPTLGVVDGFLQGVAGERGDRTLLAASVLVNTPVFQNEDKLVKFEETDKDKLMKQLVNTVGKDQAEKIMANADNFEEGKGLTQKGILAVTRTVKDQGGTIFNVQDETLTKAFDALVTSKDDKVVDSAKKTLVDAGIDKLLINQARRDVAARPGGYREKAKNQVEALQAKNNKTLIRATSAETMKSVDAMVDYLEMVGHIKDGDATLSWDQLDQKDEHGNYIYAEKRADAIRHANAQASKDRNNNHYITDEDLETDVDAVFTDSIKSSVKKYLMSTGMSEKDADAKKFKMIRDDRAEAEAFVNNREDYVGADGKKHKTASSAKELSGGARAIVDGLTIIKNKKGTWFFNNKETAESFETGQTQAAKEIGLRELGFLDADETVDSVTKSEGKEVDEIGEDGKRTGKRVIADSVQVQRHLKKRVQDFTSKEGVAATAQRLFQNIKAGTGISDEALTALKDITKGDQKQLTKYLQPALDEATRRFNEVKDKSDDDPEKQKRAAELTKITSAIAMAGPLGEMLGSVKLVGGDFIMELRKYASTIGGTSGTSKGK
jgi:hypothetical protein